MLKLRGNSSTAKMEWPLLFKRSFILTTPALYQEWKNIGLDVDKDSLIIPDDFFCYVYIFQETISNFLPRGQDSSVKLRAVVQFQ